MKKNKRFKAGFLGSCLLHLILILLLSVLGLGAAAKEDRDNIMLVSLVANPSGTAGSVKAANVAPALSPEDIVNPEERVEEEKAEETKIEDKEPQTNSGAQSGTANPDEQTGGTGTGIGEGEGEAGAQPVVPPRLVRYVKPEYPGSARAKGIEGKVVVRVLVDKAGEVETAEVYAPSGAGTLDEAAVKAAKKWEFAPARDNLGKNMSCFVLVPISFNLR